MSLTHPTSVEKKYKGKFGASWADRRALQLERDVVMMQVVEHLDVVNHELLVALLGLDDTPPMRATIARRMERLAQANEFSLLTQFDPVIGQNVTYAVTKEISARQQNTRKQLPHKLMMAKFWACVELTFPVMEKKTDRQLRAEGGFGSSGIVADGFCVLNDRAYPVECTRRDTLEKVVEKAQKYYHYREYLHDLFDHPFTVLWIAKLPGRVDTMVEKFSKIGSGGMFKVCAEKDFSVFNPLSIDSEIWVSPKDRKKYTLEAELEETNATERA
jgi:hypothetical protein